MRNMLDLMILFFSSYGSDLTSTGVQTFLVSICPSSFSITLSASFPRVRSASFTEMLKIRSTQSAPGSMYSRVSSAPPFAPLRKYCMMSILAGFCRSTCCVSSVSIESPCELSALSPLTATPIVALVSTPIPPMPSLSYLPEPSPPKLCIRSSMSTSFGFPCGINSGMESSA